MPLVRCCASELAWRVTSLPDAVLVSAAVRRWCRAQELPTRVEWELAIVASELATNIAKHAECGLLVLTIDEAPERTLRIEASDHGPGITDLARAFEDGVSEGVRLWQDPNARPPESLGSGLGAVRRLTDDITVTNLPAGGTHILASKRLPRR